jgi:hypothetical protein
MQLADLSAQKQEALPRWYVADFASLKFDRLRCRYVSDFELARFSEFFGSTPVLQLLCQNLVVMALAINEVTPP